MQTNGTTIARATVDSAGYDFKVPKNIRIKPGECLKIDTGIAFDGSERLPMYRHGRIGRMIDRLIGVRYWNDWFMMIVPRSSMGMKYGMRFTNTAGIIDKDYRGNIILEITVEKDLTLIQGERIAQGIFIPYLTYMGEKKPMQLRNGGMGSTGRK